MGTSKTPYEALHEFKYAVDYWLRVMNKVYRHEAVNYALAQLKVIDGTSEKDLASQRQTLLSGKGSIKTSEEQKEKYPRKK